MPLQIRRGTEAERQALTSVNGLVVGELLYVTDDRKIYVGTGNYPGAPTSGPNAWWKGSVATSYNDDNAKAAAGTAIIGGTHQSITFTYDNIAKTISSTLDLSDYNGTIKAGSFKGSLLTDDGSTLGGVVLVDATNGSINLDGTVKGDIVPDLNITYDIGTPLLRFKDLYLSGSSIYLGNAILSANGTAIDLPLGSTIGGSPLAGGDTSDFKGNVVADDSTIIVNTATKVVTAGGGFFGDLTGNVTGNLIGDVIGNVTGPTTGYHFGDVKGSVFADDSTILVDSTNGRISGDLVGNVVTASGAFVINPTTKTATLTAINLESSGVVSGPALTITVPSITYATNALAAAPWPNLLTVYNTGATTNSLGLSRARGTSLFSQTTVLNGDSIGIINNNAFDGTSFVTATEIESVVNGAVGTGVVPARIDIKTTDALGSLATIVSVKSSAVDFNSPPKLPVVSNDTARTTLVPVPAQGMLIFMQSGTTPAATNVVQVFDGTNWVNLH